MGEAAQKPPGGILRVPAPAVVLRLTGLRRDCSRLVAAMGASRLALMAL